MQITVATCIDARNDQRLRDAEAHRDRIQPVRAIELDVLAGIENVEAADPQTDRQAEQPGLRRADRTAGREPAADRRHGHRQAKECLRVRGVALRERIPEHDRERDRRQQPARRDSAGTPRTRTRSTTRSRRASHRERLSAPRGISRIAVRGLSASMRASTSRLKPIAALRADTIATMTHRICRHSNGACCHASNAPVSANGKREDRVAEPDER